MTLANELRKLILGIYIEDPKKRICLWVLINTKETTHDLPYIFSKLVFFWTTMRADYYQVDLDFIDIFWKAKQ